MESTRQIAQQVDNGLQLFAPMANLTAVGVLIVLVMWGIFRGFPRVLDRWDQMSRHFTDSLAKARREFMEVIEARSKENAKALDDARREFLAALDRQTEQRSIAAASGHDAAAAIHLDLQNISGEMRRANDLKAKPRRQSVHKGNPKT